MSGLRAERLGIEAVREALRLLGVREPPATKAAAVRELRETLRSYGTVRGAVDRAPSGAGDAFARLAAEGPLAVEALLGRGWWGHGSLPPPLDWLQKRALIQVGDDGLVHATVEAREGFLDVALWSPGDAPLDEPEAEGPDGPAPVRVEAVASVVVAPESTVLDRAVAVADAELRQVAPTVAVSRRSARSVSAALRSSGVALVADAIVDAEPDEPALPGTQEQAVGPGAVRRLLERGVSEQRQVRLQYFASSRGGAATDRVVDPWRFADDLLVGYCHLRTGERTFAVDRIGRAILLASPVRIGADGA